MSNGSLFGRETREGGALTSPAGTPSVGRIASGQGSQESQFDPLSIGVTAAIGGIGSWAQSRSARKDREARERMAREERLHELEKMRLQNLLPDWIYAIVKTELSKSLSPHGGFARAVQSTQGESAPSLPGAGAGSSPPMAGPSTPPPVRSRLTGGV